MTKRFGRQTVVDGVSFSALPGQVVVLVGPNGAGKSTVLAMLAGVLTPSAGDILIGGRSIIRAPRAVAGLIGTVLGFALGRSRYCIGIGSKVAIVFIQVFFLVFINTYAGVAAAALCRALGQR